MLFAAKRFAPGTEQLFVGRAPRFSAARAECVVSLALGLKPRRQHWANLGSLLQTATEALTLIPAFQVSSHAVSFLAVGDSRARCGIKRDPRSRGARQLGNGNTRAGQRPLGRAAGPWRLYEKAAGPAHRVARGRDLRGFPQSTEPLCRRRIIRG